ncbi:MAG: ATP-binding cassette domain-containing protein [Bryobacteraceae bacterium]
MTTPLIEYQNITVCRGEKVALDSITLSIAVGEHVAILGPNGCGKSTLIKTMTRECYPRLDGPDSWMRIMGKEIWNVFDLRAMLGIVSNDLMLSCTRDYSAREIVLSGFFSSVGIWPNHHVTPEMEERTEQLLKQFEISHLAERNTDELSSGEARRVLIARALVHEPKALVLDEPTTSLDFHATHELRETLRKVAQAGTSVVLVTHHLPDIVPEVERVILMREGKVLRDGAKHRVLSSKALSEVFATKAEVVERDGYYQVW